MFIRIEFGNASYDSKNESDRKAVNDILKVLINMIDICYDNI